MSSPNSFFDSPVKDVPDDIGTLLNSPFMLARVVGYEDEYTPLFEISFGSGMQKEDVPLVVELLYEVFLPQIEAIRALQDAPQ